MKVFVEAKVAASLLMRTRVGHKDRRRQRSRLGGLLTCANAYLARGHSGTFHFSTSTASKRSCSSGIASALQRRRAADALAALTDQLQARAVDGGAPGAKSGRQ